jgi:hypothetical protein
LGFFTDDELGSLKITNMILHVVGGGNFEPAPAREVEHEKFFLDRITNTDVSPVYSFADTSATKAEVQRIYKKETSFEDGAQTLAREFSRLHVYSLIKYDYREAIEQPEGNGGLLRRIVHAFIADKKAIQKSAIIRVKDGVADSVISTTDRMKPAPAIGDYFAAFLDAARSLSDEELNKKVVEMLRELLADNKESLPNKDVALAFGIAKNILRDRQEINEDAISDAVITAAGNPEDENIQAKLRVATRRKIRGAKLDGLSFKPDPKVLKRPILRKVKTIEGVTILYPDQDGMVTVSRERKGNGGETITVETKQVTEDTVVRN